MTLLFGRLGNETNAMTRTTVAITTLEGSAGANVLAATARANANIRVAVGETVEGTVERLRKIIRDPKVELRVVEGNDPSPVSPSSGPQWELLEDCHHRGLPRGAHHPVHHDGRHGFAPLHRDLRRRVPLRPVLHGRPGARLHPRRRREDRAGDPGAAASASTKR